MVLRPLEDASGANLDEIMDILRCHADIQPMYGTAEVRADNTRSSNFGVFVLTEMTRNKQKSSSKLW